MFPIDLLGDSIGIFARGQILGRNWDKSLKSISCYSHSQSTTTTETSSLRILSIMPRNLIEITRTFLNSASVDFGSELCNYLLQLRN